MIDAPLVTVIVASYNGARTLKFTLKSIQSQEMQDFEVWIIGDHSTDDSASVVDSMNDPRFFWKNLFPRCGVQSAPNNEGLKLAKGKYIAYLGHDDLWFPWHLSELVSAIQKTKTDLVFSLSALIGPDGVRYFTGPSSPSDYKINFAPPSSWLHRKDLIETTGFWRCDIKRTSLPVDRDFWERGIDSHKIFHFHPSLSVLKFPSPWWGFYGEKTSFPQKEFSLPLEQSAKKLQTQLLTQGIIHSTLLRKNKWKIWIKKIIYLYGIHREPLSSILRWHFQRKRKKNLKLRGLYD